LQNVATGLQSSGSSTGNIKTSSIKISHVTPEGSGWTSQTYNLTWTTTSGATVTEEGSLSTRYLDSNSNPISSPVSVEVNMNVTPPTLKISYLAKYLQSHTHFSKTNYYQGAMNMTFNFPTGSANINLTNPVSITLSTTGEGSITFVGSTISTFEMQNLILAITIEAVQTSVTVTSRGFLDWAYKAPVSIYAYYYGTVTMDSNSANATQPSAMVGDVYQDITNDGVKNGIKIGTITMDPTTGTIKITLNNGTVLYSGNFGS